MPAVQIMVVEDERIVAESLRRRLQALGYVVPVVVASGEKAVQQAEGFLPDLVLMDISLEGQMDGVEAASRIRDQFRIPVVYLTAYSNAEVLERAKITEPLGFILKPFDDRELQVVIEMALYKNKMERALRDRERWLAAVLSSIGDAVIATDGTGRVTFLNRHAEVLTGWKESEAKTRPVHEVVKLVNEATRQPVEIPLIQAIQERRSVPLQNHTILIGRDHSERPLNDAATPIVDEKGVTHGGVMVFRDVSQQKRASEKEKQERLFLQAVLDSFPGHLAVLDDEGTVLHVNEGWSLLASEIGRPLPCPPVGANYLADCRRVFSEGSQTAKLAADGLQRLIAGEEGRFCLEYRCYTGDEERWFLMIATPLTHAQGRVIVMHVNITDQRKAEMAAFKLSAIDESSQDAIIGKTLNGIITSWNHGAEHLYGYSADEVIGKHISILVPDRFTDDMVAAIEKVRRGQKAGFLETRRRRKDGREVDVVLSVSPVMDGEGNLIGAATIARDITGVKRLEQQLRQSQKMEAIGRLAGGVAHDFNNLLTIINGYSEIVIGSLRDHPSAKEMVEHIRQAGQRAADLTSQLLAYSRKTIQQLKIIDLNQLVGPASVMLSRLIGEDVRIVTTLHPATCRVKADPSQIEQILMNLAVNARDAMPEGGTLSIRTSRVDGVLSDGSESTATQPGPYVLLEVEDTGTGMAADTLSHIFEPFFTTKDQGKGTGLGLAMVYGVVKQTGGEIKVVSAPGRGTTFKIYLPRILDDADESRGPRDMNAMPGGTETVLLVEDEAGIRSLTRMVLCQNGYTVLEAANGEQALEVARRHHGPIDLLVTDVVMPAIGGRALAESLGQMHPNVRVLYVSGHNGDVVLRQGIVKAQVAFLQKPFSMVEFARKVRETLDVGA